jgi:predicted metalloprotease
MRKAGPAWGVLMVVTCLAVLLPAAGARAAPYRDPLARTGRLIAGSCAEPAIVQGGIPRTREYLTAILKCLDKSWSAHLARARLTFRKPAVRFYEAPGHRVCGVPWPEGAAAFYCTNRARLVFPLTGRWIEDRTDLYPLKVAAHEYGHHVQSLTGSRDHYESAVRAGKAPQAELSRRYELQADCLSGVFLGSVWSSLERTDRDWAALLEATRASGDDAGGHRGHGTGATRARWLKRGYQTTYPGACDTWSAPAGKLS